ncbi:MAG: hypothetical protein CMK49_02405 [Prochlorococcus sp. SP3034]|nr:hypothetical protein [Prochlorococcus sp. SP3034]|tara:strand:- start:5457 stop:6443 length:987 start_codon:yes stop_codon:yes gene_type:complete
MSNYSFFSRRRFFTYIKLLFVFLLTSCTKESNKKVIGYQKSFLPESFKKLIPTFWNKENVNFGDIYEYKNTNKYQEIDYLLVNDGWINNVKFDDFKNLDKNLFLKLNYKSKEYLKSFDEGIRHKLFPIGVIPYAIVIKNNYYTRNIYNESWDLLLTKELKGKIILPNSPRILLSIAERIDDKNALSKLINQQNIYDDKNVLDWLLNSKTALAVIPYSLCQKYLKIDPRISVVFPRTGVPLIWQFVMSKKYSNEKPLLEWLNALENYKALNLLKKEGWYIPFENINFENYKTKNNEPSQECWQNSWSLSLINEEEKAKLEILWGNLLTP